MNTYLCHVLILHSISEMVSSLLVHQGLVLEVAGSGPHKMPFHAKELQCTHLGGPVRNICNAVLDLQTADNI